MPCPESWYLEKNPTRVAPLHPVYTAMKTSQIRKVGVVYCGPGSLLLFSQCGESLERRSCLKFSELNFCLCVGSSQKIKSIRTWILRMAQVTPTSWCLNTFLERKLNTPSDPPGSASCLSQEWTSDQSDQSAQSDSDSDDSEMGNYVNVNASVSGWGQCCPLQARRCRASGEGRRQSHHSPLTQTTADTLWPQVMLKAHTRHTHRHRYTHACTHDY